MVDHACAVAASLTIPEEAYETYLGQQHDILPAHPTYAEGDNDICKVKWIEHSFSGKASYHSTGVNQLLHDIPAQNPEAIQALAGDHGRVMNPDEYQAHINTFQQLSPPMIQANYATPRMKMGHGKDRRKQAYWSNVCNRLLSLASAIAPNKNGAPVILVGKPTFKSSMIGKKSAPPKFFYQYIFPDFLQ